MFEHFKSTISQPAVGNLYDPEKLMFNTIVAVDLKEWKSKHNLYYWFFQPLHKGDFVS